MLTKNLHKKIHFYNPMNIKVISNRKKCECDLCEEEMNFITESKHNISITHMHRKE